MSLRVHLSERTLTSNIGLWVLRDGLECGEDSIDDIINFEVGYELFEFAIGDATNLRLNIVEVLDIIPKKRFEILFSHGLCELLNLGNKLIPNSPSKLI